MRGECQGWHRTQAALFQITSIEIGNNEVAVERSSCPNERQTAQGAGNKKGTRSGFSGCDGAPRQREREEISRLKKALAFRSVDDAPARRQDPSMCTRSFPVR